MINKVYYVICGANGSDCCVVIVCWLDTPYGLGSVPISGKITSGFMHLQGNSKPANDIST